jgi:hypothetical protein
MTDTPWFTRIMNSPDRDSVIDKIYKQANNILDERVTTYKQIFTQQGTTDFDAMDFVLAANFIQQNVDPAMVAALAIVGIHRLARQP